MSYAITGIWTAEEAKAKVVKFLKKAGELQKSLWALEDEIEDFLQSDMEMLPKGENKRLPDYTMYDHIVTAIQDTRWSGTEDGSPTSNEAVTAAYLENIADRLLDELKTESQKF